MDRSISTRRRSRSLRHLKPTVQMLIMLGFALLVAGAVTLAGYVIPEFLTGAVTRP